MRVAGPDMPQEPYRQAPASCTPVGEGRGDEPEERARHGSRSSFPALLIPASTRGTCRRPSLDAPAGPWVVLAVYGQA